MKNIVVGVCAGIGSVAFAALPVSVKTAKPVVVTESEPVSFVGRLEGSATVKVSARVVGTMWSSNGDEGDEVKKGDVLFTIEDTIYKANLQTAKAKEAELTAQLALAEVEAKRYIDSEAKGGVSKSDRDRVVLKRDVAKAELDAAKAQVILCQNDLDYCTIKSPINGRLGRGTSDVGNNIGPDTGTLRDIIAVDPIDVTVSIPEPRLIWAFENEQVKKNIKIRMLRSDNKEYPVELKLFALDNKVDAATGTVLCRLRGSNPDGVLMPGGYVKILVNEVFAAPKYTLPMSAVIFHGDKRYVYVVKDGSVVRREVVLGCLTGDHVFVESGVDKDESVVVAGIHKLVDGAKVKEM